MFTAIHSPIWRSHVPFVVRVVSNRSAFALQTSYAYRQVSRITSQELVGSPPPRKLREKWRPPCPSMRVTTRSTAALATCRGIVVLLLPPALKQYAQRKLQDIR